MSPDHSLETAARAPCSGGFSLIVLTIYASCGWRRPPGAAISF
jgi:hypothetical protein